MSARRATASAIAAAAATLQAFIPAAAAARPKAARLEGTFALTGRVTLAVHVKGEHRGQYVSRTWGFSPLCPAGACANVQLLRARAGGADALTLTRVAPGYYRGRSRFTAPLGCDGQVDPVGETVPFTITVRITAASAAAGGRIATRIKATYTSRARINNTSCVFPPSRDAAVYRGTLITATPSARHGLSPPAHRGVSARSPAGS